MEKWVVVLMRGRHQMSNGLRFLGCWIAWTECILTRGFGSVALKKLFEKSLASTTY
jgi:hypothetical protein